MQLDMIIHYISVDYLQNILEYHQKNIELNSRRINKIKIGVAILLLLYLINFYLFMFLHEISSFDKALSIISALEMLVAKGVLVTSHKRSNAETSGS